VRRRTSIAQPRRRSSILSWSLCASRGRAPLAPRVAALARQVDAGLHLRDIVTLDDIVAQEQTRMVVGSVVFGSVLLVAVVFSAAGLYALMAVAVARRTREIGIRIALGATPGTCSAACSPAPAVSSAAASSPATASSCSLAWRADSLTADLVVLVGDHVRHHGGRGCACVRGTGATRAAYSTDRGAPAGVTCH
jgi:flagellin-like protein